MSELTTFRDHARRMAEAEHDCKRIWRDTRGQCQGCADRALWLRLADEVDAYLSHDEEGALFG